MAKPARANQRNAGEHILNRKPFKASNFSGGSSSTGLGRLPEDEAAKFKEHNPEYVVNSYQTPIAWYSEKAGWHVPSTKYSSSTSKHQNVVRRAVEFGEGKDGATKWFQVRVNLILAKKA